MKFSSELPPKEAPLMITEKRKLFPFFFSLFYHEVRFGVSHREVSMGVSYHKVNMGVSYHQIYLWAAALGASPYGP